MVQVDVRLEEVVFPCLRWSWAWTMGSFRRPTCRRTDNPGGGEHALRYADLAEALNVAGYAARRDRSMMHRHKEVRRTWASRISA